MKAFCIKCNQNGCGGECGEWIGRAKKPPEGHVSFPLLGAFAYVPEDERLAWKSKEIADALCKAMIMDQFTTEWKVWSEDKHNLLVVGVEWPDGLTPGRFQG